MAGYSYNRDLIGFSKLNRKNQTDAEKFLWNHLRSRIHEYKFRRQFPIDTFILDFYCVKRKLAIELDGGQHKNRRIYDRWRSARLAKRGITVLRFWDNEIFQNIQGVLEKILLELNKTPL